MSAAVSPCFASRTRRPDPAVAVRHDWRVGEVVALHERPLFELLDRAREVHRRAHPGGRVELCSLVSVKTGGCPEDCGYCAQSARFSGGAPPPRVLELGEVLAAARSARELGATRLCLSAAWRAAADGGGFERVLQMVQAVKALGLETCCTLGMLTEEQARRLKQVGLDAYNHNLDSSRDYHARIVTTHSYADRLATLRAVRAAGIQICSGGIIGMGESVRDRAAMLVELAGFDPHPESIPINALVPIPGTPLATAPPVRPVELVRLIATARIVLPRSRIRLAAGRAGLAREAQLMCLYAGANSLFLGERLLTTPNADPGEDLAMLAEAGIDAKLLEQD
ncbi:MAG: biotin synthase BioB [Deltaproteobacteria bacterium]|nr:biotin synthase BioB [Deltaproteobacteria bacterium]